MDYQIMKKYFKDKISWIFPFLVGYYTSKKIRKASTSKLIVYSQTCSHIAYVWKCNFLLTDETTAQGLKNVSYQFLGRVRLRQVKLCYVKLRVRLGQVSLSYIRAKRQAFPSIDLGCFLGSTRVSCELVSSQAPSLTRGYARMCVCVCVCSTLHKLYISNSLGNIRQ